MTTYTLIHKNWSKKIAAICAVNTIHKLSSDFDYEFKRIGYNGPGVNGSDNLLPFLLDKIHNENGRLFYNKATGYAILMMDRTGDVWFEWTNKIEW